MANSFDVPHLRDAVKSTREYFCSQHTNLSPTQQQQEFEKLLIQAARSKKSSLPSSTIQNDDRNMLADMITSPPHKRRRVENGEMMSRLHSSPLPSVYTHASQNTFSPFVNAEAPQHTHVNRSEDGYRGSQALAVPRRDLSSGNQPQSIQVDEFAPTDYLGTDDITSFQKTSSSPLANGYAFGVVPSPAQQSLFPQSSSPMSSSSGTSFNAWTNPTSIDMSRQDSLGNSSFYRRVDMMRLDSKTSNRMSDTEMEAPETSPRHQQQPNVDQYIGLSNSFSNAPYDISHAGGATDSVDIPENPYINGSAFNLDQDIDSHMQREPSASSNQHVASTRRLEAAQMQKQTSTSSRNTEAEIAGGLALLREPSSASSSGGEYEMVRVPSSDGSYRTAVRIPNTSPGERPKAIKVKCPFKGCVKKPEGYKGEHEMKRHYERDHEAIRQVYVCVPLLDNPHLLAKCKHCEKMKMYNADYNAGEHLRRIHFNPKPKVRRGKVPRDQLRGGKGGGKLPTMEELRKYMITFEVNQSDERVSEPRKVIEDSNLIMPDLGDLEAQESTTDRASSPDTQGHLSEMVPDWNSSTTVVEDTGSAVFDPNNPPLGPFDDTILFNSQHDGSTMYPGFYDVPALFPSLEFPK